MTASGEALSEALAAGDQRSFGSLLREAEVATLLAGPSTPQILTDEQGTRGIAVFTSPESARRWDRPGRLGVVAGAHVAEMATRQGVDVVLFDPAGPAPVSVSPEHLQALLDGIVVDDTDDAVLVDDLQARSMPPERAAPIRDALRGAPTDHLELFLLERRAAGRWVPTLAAFGPDPQVAALAHDLSTKDIGDVLDVIAIPDSVRDRLAERLAPARVWPGC